MQVPHSVVAAALAAFEQRSGTGVVLDLRFDTAIDDVYPGLVRVPDSVRTLVFGGVVEVQVDVLGPEAAPQLHVDVRPRRHVQVVEVVSLVPHLHLVGSGFPPLRVSTTATGPTTLELTLQGVDGLVRYRTAWVVL
jgi:hypothetical protein